VKILIACSEFFPLISTGDVADYTASISATLGRLTHDVRVILPAYPDAMNRALPVETLATLNLPGCNEPVRLLRSKAAGLNVPVYLVDAPEMFNRHGHPYVDVNGVNRADNAQRFAAFSHCVVKVALNQADLNWKADLVHCNDWQTGLVPALLALDWNRPATVFSCHFHDAAGNFAADLAQKLRIPPNLLGDTLQHEQQLSYLKAGLQYADAVTISSQTLLEALNSNNKHSACEDLLLQANHRLHAFHCPIDTQRWDPANDSHIKQPYDLRSINLKAVNKKRLLEQANNPQAENRLLLAIFADRIVDDSQHEDVLDLPLLQQLLQLPLTLAFDCSGDAAKKKQLQNLQQQFPQQVILCEKASDAWLHYLLAAADASLFTDAWKITNLKLQYSLAYATVPVVRSAYQASDFVMDATSDNLLANKTNGYLYSSTQNELLPVLEKMVKYYERPGPWWKKLMTNCMNTDIGGSADAGKLLDCYQYAIDHPVPNPSQSGN
jgi:starch synthase